MKQNICNRALSIMPTTIKEKKKEKRLKLHISINNVCKSSSILCLSFSSELTQIIADVSQDPTLPRTEDHPCPK